ncbi:cobalt-precorrin-6A reductase [Denitrobaculum tricleocarpae]|uniref:Cobalt-precorrin-6A reductase n=1 Tax=Denitrobaculum tricleocarpae TaxID=2591009 RepID=A0A545TMN3_9PROT|nr:cobalt-precorrin-6A reductase [Denitrobaculum tricleocarpae]TQV78428.1 cobalt-precorrin-6A reductase [Denitrobaculum tricleocarpae]
MPAKTRVLILGGTGEATHLAELMDKHDRFEIVSSLAGRTRDPALPPGQVRSGGFGGIAGLANYLRDDTIGAVVDATHPYAAQISDNAVHACKAVNLPLLQLLRPEWRETDDDRWIPVENTESAAAAISDHGFQRIFLSTGRQDLAPFAALRDPWFLLRTIDPPDNRLGLQNCEIVLGRGPFEADAEADLMRQYRIDAIVTKNSGGTATYGKIEAARRLKLPVIMIQRPPGAALRSASSVKEAAEWLEHHARS